jgi:transposase-like protein
MKEVSPRGESRSEIVGDSLISFVILIQNDRRGKDAAAMALSDDLRERVVHAVRRRDLSRTVAAKRFGVSIATAVRWLQRLGATGEISPARRVATAGCNV